MGSGTTKLDESFSMLFKAHPWHGLSPGEDAPEVVSTFIEVVPTDTVKFEAGFGYRNDSPDADDVDDITGWSAYGQVVLTLAPGVDLIPEVGYFDYGDDPITDDDNGYTWYAGAKWQIDF